MNVWRLGLRVWDLGLHVRDIDLRIRRGALGGGDIRGWRGLGGRRQWRGGRARGSSLCTATFPLFTRPFALLFGALREQFLTRRHLGLLQLCARLPLGVLDDSLRLSLGIGNLGAPAPALHGVSGPHAKHQRERDQQLLHRVSFYAWPPPKRPPSSNQVCEPGVPLPTGACRGSGRLRKAKVRPELIEDANRCKPTRLSAGEGVEHW